VGNPGVALTVGVIVGGIVRVGARVGAASVCVGAARTTAGLGKLVGASVGADGGEGLLVGSAASSSPQPAASSTSASISSAITHRRFVILVSSRAQIAVFPLARPTEY